MTLNLPTWRGLFFGLAIYICFVVQMRVFRDCFAESTGGFCQLFSQGISLEFNAIRGLNESVQQCIGDGWIGHVLMPVFDG